MSQRLQRRILVLACAAVFLAAWSNWDWAVEAQTPSKRPLSYDVFDLWRAIQGTTLSDDGRWLAYALTSRADENDLVVRNLDSGAERRYARGAGPRFTPDGRYLLFTITAPEDEEESGDRASRGRRGGRGGDGDEDDDQPRNSLGIVTLATGDLTEIENVGSFRLPEESSTWLAYYRGTGGGGGAGRGGRGGRGRGGRGGGRQAGPPAGEQAEGDDEPQKDPGSDLIIRNLTSGQEVTVAEVTSYAWDVDGSMLAYTTSSEDTATDGAYVRSIGDGSVTPLLSGAGHYKNLTWDDEAGQLAFYSDRNEYGQENPTFALYHWERGERTAAELLSATSDGMPDGMIVVDSAGPRFSEDGARLFVSTRQRPEPEDEDAPDPIAVDIWHFEDPWLQPMQRVRANQERNRAYQGVVHLSEGRFVQLATADLPSVNAGEQAEYATGTSDVPYRQEVSWDQTYRDIYVVDLDNGRRTKILEHFPGNASMSPGGGYLLYFDEPEASWFSYRISNGQRVNLTAGLGVNFWREDHDTPDLPGAYGTAGWTEDDRTVLIYDKYDIWEIQPDGRNARLITGGTGREQQFVFRYAPLERGQRVIPTDRPLRLSTTNDVTKASGYYEVAYENGTPTEVVMLDKRFGGVTKAADADRVVFTLQRFDEFPNLWVSDTAFGGMTKVSDANPQQAEFIWGTSELIEYINTDGKALRAILTKPENFDPTETYPLMVYIYEGLTQNLHSYRAPNVGTSINISRYVSNGYVVLQPDIIYDTGYPGESAEKCVIPAVNTVLAEGYIDPERVGIQGHSWGGYQITHLITRTDMFAAVQAGASVTNMTSAYGGIRWGSGMSRAFQYERTQSRIGAPPWDATLEFIENSPLFWVEKVNTPWLSIHNDEDDAVPWYQGIEFFNALRRLGKEAYLFVYNGEPHGLRNRDNQKHWTVHQDEFFDHYLLGTERPDWMVNGVPFLQKGTRDVLSLFERAEPPPPGGGGR